MYNLKGAGNYCKGVFSLGVNTKDMVLSASEARDVLKGIKFKIESNPLLKEVYDRKDDGFTDLIAEYSGEKVMLAVQLVESYRLLSEMGKNYFD